MYFTFCIVFTKCLINETVFFRVSCYCIFSIEHSHFPCVCVLKSVLDESCIFLTLEVQPAPDNFYISDPQKYLLQKYFGWTLHCLNKEYMWAHFMKQVLKLALLSIAMCYICHISYTVSVLFLLHNLISLEEWAVIFRICSLR